MLSPWQSQFFSTNNKMKLFLKSTPSMTLSAANPMFQAGPSTDNIVTESKERIIEPRAAWLAHDPSQIVTPGQVLVALHPFNALNADELEIQAGCQIFIINHIDHFWYMAQDSHGNAGMVPKNIFFDSE